MSIHSKKGEFPQLNISEKADMFHAIVDLGEVGILVLDEQNRIEFANDMASSIIECEVGELLGKDFSQFLDEKNREVFQALEKDSDLYTSKLCQEIEIITTSSTPAMTQIACTSYATDRSEKRKIFVYLRDISIQRKLTEDLKQSEKKYHELFDRIEQGISISTKEGKFLDCNPALLAILGYSSKEEFLKIDITKDLYADPADRKEFQRRIERDGHVKNFEVEFKKNDGKKIPMLLTSHAIKNKKGEVTGYQGLNIDISERVRMEHELQ